MIAALLLAALFSGRTSGQLRQYTATLASLGDSTDELFSLAAGHYERQEWAEAAAAFHRFSLAAPDDQRVGTAWFYSGEAFLHAGDLRSARAAYQHFLLRRTNPELVEKATFRIAEIAAREQDANAVRLLESFLTAWPQSQWREFALYYLGHLRLARKEPQLARRVLDQAIAEFPSSQLRTENLLGAGVACRMMNDPESAARYFATLAAESTGEIRQGAQVQLASVLVLQQDHAAASQIIEELFADGAPAPALAGEAWLLNGICQRENGIHEGAAASFVQSVALAADDEIASLATWHLANCLLRTGRLDEAAAQFQTLVDEWPEHQFAPDAAALLVEAAAQSGDWKRVVDTAARYSAHWEGSRRAREIRELVGRAWYEQSQYAACLGIFRDLLGTEPKASPGDRSRWIYFAGASQLGLHEDQAAAATLSQVQVDDVPAELQPVYLHTLATALVQTRQFGRAKDAIGRLEQLPQSGLKPDQLALLKIVVATAREDWVGLDTLLGGMNGEALRDQGIATAVWRAGEAALQARQTAAARQAFDLIVASSADAAIRAEALAGLGWIELNGGNDAAALELFERLSRDYPESEATRRSWIAQAAIHERRESWETAAWLYGVAAQAASTDAARQVALFKQAVVLRKSGDAWSITRGGSILEELAKEQPTAISRDQLDYELAWFDSHRGNQAASLARFESITADAPDSPLWPDAALRTARRQIAAGEKEGAQRLLARILERPDVPAEIAQRAHFLLGQLAAGAGDWSNADRHMRSALALAPPRELQLRCSYWLAECAWRRQQYPEALAAFTTLAAAESEFDAELVPWLSLRQAQCLAALQRWPQASELAISGKGRFPAFSGAWEFDWIQGRALFASGKFEQAIAAFERVVAAPQTKRTDAAAQAEWMIGESLLHQEKYAAAIAAYRRVDSLYQSPLWRSAALLQAGKCQVLLGNPRQAAALFEQLVKKFPDSPHSAEAGQRLASLQTDRKQAR